MDKEELQIESIVNQYLKPVYGLVYRLTNNSEMSKDITQEVFIKIWRNLNKYDEKKNFKTWLFTIARNTTIDWLRKKKATVFSELAGEDDSQEEFDNNFSDQLIDPELLPEELFARSELKEQLEKTLARISLNERLIVLLHLEDELTFEEIAIIVSRPLNTVKSQYRRALINLRKILQVAPK